MVRRSLTIEMRHSPVQRNREAERNLTKPFDGLIPGGARSMIPCGGEMALLLVQESDAKYAGLGGCDGVVLALGI